MSYDRFHISKIIAGFFTKTNTEEEKVKLKDWLNQSEEHAHLFADLSDYDLFENWESLYKAFEKKADWNHLRKTVKKSSSLKKVFSTVAKVAAVLFIPLVIGIWVHKVSNDTLLNTTIVVPKGVQHCLTLSDGTRVWLNTDTKFTYPRKFNAKKREVLLNGEAYFEVMPNQKSEFVVKAGEVDIVVVGTEFNVYAYRDEDLFRITLNKGKVKVRSSQEEVILNQNQQASMTPRNELVIDRDIDASIYSAWRYHTLSYKDQTLKTITEDLERYYNVQFKFEKPSLAQMRFSINVERFNDVFKLLDLLKETGKIDYIIKKNVIVIKET